MGKTGFTLQEVLIGILLASVITLMVGKSVSDLTKSQLRNTAQADMQDDAIRIIEKLTVALGKAGDGVPNSSTTLGQSIFAATWIVDASSITFFSKDLDQSGTMSAGDEWTRYRLSGGRIYEEKFLTGAWTNITSLSVPSSQRILPLASNAHVSVLQFNFYSSGSYDNSSANPTDPPQLIMDPHAASWVRVHMELQKSGVTVSKDAWVLLRNVVYARQM